MGQVSGTAAASVADSMSCRSASNDDFVLSRAMIDTWKVLCRKVLMGHRRLLIILSLVLSEIL